MRRDRRIAQSELDNARRRAASLLEDQRSDVLGITPHAALAPMHVLGFIWALFLMAVHCGMTCSVQASVRLLLCRYVSSLVRQIETRLTNPPMSKSASALIGRREALNPSPVVPCVPTLASHDLIAQRAADPVMACVPGRHLAATDRRLELGLCPLEAFCTGKPSLTGDGE